MFHEATPNSLRRMKQAGRRAGALSLACGLALLQSGVRPEAQQADRARTEGQSRRAAERLQSLQREADRLASDERTLLNDLRRLELARAIKAGTLKRASEEADHARADLESTTARIEQLERQDVAERPGLRARLIEMYKLGRARYLRLLLSTSDVRDLGRASRMVAALAEMDRERVAAHQQTLDALKAARVDLEARGRQAETLRAEAQAAEAAAAAAARARASLVNDIDHRRDLNAQLAGELQAAQQKLQATLRDLASGNAAAEPSLPLRPFRGALEWPAAGPVRRMPGPKGAAGRESAGGIEIAAAEGAAVRAIHEGSVAFADPFAGYGNLVIVDHGAQAFSLYGDLEEVLVKRGARIERGQIIGHVGSTPTGAAGLYFELRIDGRAVDPLQWLKQP